MDKEKQKDYVRRVSQANKTELVAITFEIMLDGIDEAKEYLDEGNTDEFKLKLKTTGRFLSELMHALDFGASLSLQLLRLYEYVQRILISCEMSGCDRGLASARKVLAGLGAAFSEISSQDTSGCVMENAQPIYAGLTYGKGVLNEADMAAGTNRGFLA